MTIYKLNLNSDQLNSISKDARIRKFDIPNETLLYSISPKQDAITFIKCYRFLENIGSNLSYSDAFKGIPKLIKDYLKQFEEIYHRCIFHVVNLDDHISFGCYHNKKKLFKFIEENNNDIRILINDVYPIGKVVKEYDLEGSLGYS